MKGISEILKKNVTFWFFALLSAGIGIAGFIVPPPGELHPSVLKFISLMFAFAALWVAHEAIDRGMDAKVSYGNAKVEITNDDPVARKPETELETVEVEVDEE